MPKPSELPVWTTTLANRVKPLAGALASGFLYGQRCPPKWVNYLIGHNADWVTWLDEATDRLVPTTQLITTVGTTVWLKPSTAQFVDFVLVGGGQAGTAGGVNVGGKGGDAGEILTVSYPAALLPSSLDLVVGNGGVVGAGRGDYTYIKETGGTEAIALACHGGPIDISTWPGVSTPRRGNTDIYNTRTQGGAAALPGMHSGYGPAGPAGSSSTTRGFSGFGYGAGGGGGRNASGTNQAGGGGAGGYGMAQPDGVGGGTSSNGFAGARGCILVTTWRNLT